MARQWTEEQKQAAREKALANKGVAVAEKPDMDAMKREIVADVTKGVLEALRESPIVVNPANRPRMERSNPGIEPQVDNGNGYRCRCGLIHTPEMHYNIDIKPGMHYVNVEDWPDSSGIPSDIQKFKSRGFECKMFSDRHAVMWAPEAVAMKHRDDAAQQSRARVMRDARPESEAQRDLTRGVDESGYYVPKRGSAIHIDLSRAPSDAPSFSSDEGAEPDY